MRHSTTRNPIVMEKWEELTTTSTRIPDPVHICSTLVVVPVAAAASFICRAKMAQSDQGTWQDAGLPDSGPQKKSFAGLGAWSAFAQTGKLSSNPTHC